MADCIVVTEIGGKESKVGGSINAGLSKNKLRKLRKHDRVIPKRLKMKEERKVHKPGCNRTGTPRRRRPHVDEKARTAEKMNLARETGPKVVIDCQFNDRMSPKEQRHLAQQLRRIYASNKMAASPLSLYWTSIDETSSFFKICTQVNDGFASYSVQRTDKSFLDFLSPKLDQLMYLSPDATTVLEEFDPSKIYVIGGLVDETVQSKVTKNYSTSEMIPLARLPIHEYFEHGPSSGTFKTILTVNQVVDIMLKWYETKDWVKAIQAGLPNRTGFVPKKIQ